MNYILLTILIGLFYVGYIQFKRSKEQVTEVEHTEPQGERELTSEQVRKVNIVQAWASRQRNLIYDELNPTVKQNRL